MILKKNPKNCTIERSLKKLGMRHRWGRVGSLAVYTRVIRKKISAGLQVLGLGETRLGRR